MTRGCGITWMLVPDFSNPKGKIYFFMEIFVEMI